MAQSLLVIVYHMLPDKQPYRDLGADFFEARDKERVVKGALRRLESLGYTVTLQAHEEVSASHHPCTHLGSSVLSAPPQSWFRMLSFWGRTFSEEKPCSRH